MDTDKLLRYYKLSKMGFAPDELKKPLIVVLYEQNCDGYVSDVKCGIIKKDCAFVGVCLPQIDSFNASKTTAELLLPSREAIADLVETILNLHRADGAVVVASSDIVLSGAIMGCVRKNVPFSALPIINISLSNKDPLMIKSLAECGKISLVNAEEELSSVCARMDDFLSLSLFLEGSGATVLGSFNQNKTDLARRAGILASTRAIELSYPKKDYSLNSFESGLAVFLSAKGSSSSLLHIIAIGRENSVNIDFEYVCNLSSKIPVMSDSCPAEQMLNAGVVSLLTALVQKKAISIIPQGYLSQFCAHSGGEISLDGDSVINRVKGNVANDGIARFTSAQKQFKGVVKAYESEELARAAILSGTDFDNSAIVISGQSARDNGMPPLDIESALSAVNAQNTIIITDGRLVELGIYPTISLIDKTENFDVIKSGDQIEIDFKKGKINLGVGAKDIAMRIKKLSPPLKSHTLIRYANAVSDCSKGCTLKK